MTIFQKNRAHLLSRILSIRESLCEFYQFAKVYVRESFWARKFLCAKVPALKVDTKDGICRCSLVCPLPPPATMG